MRESLDFWIRQFSKFPSQMFPILNAMDIHVFMLEGALSLCRSFFVAFLRRHKIDAYFTNLKEVHLCSIVRWSTMGTIVLNVTQVTGTSTQEQIICSTPCRTIPYIDEIVYLVGLVHWTFYVPSSFYVRFGLSSKCNKFILQIYYPFLDAFLQCVNCFIGTFRVNVIWLSVSMIFCCLIPIVLQILITIHMHYIARVPKRSILHMVGFREFQRLHKRPLSTQIACILPFPRLPTINNPPNISILSSQVIESQLVSLPPWWC